MLKYLDYFDQTGKKMDISFLNVRPDTGILKLMYLKII